MTAAGLHCAIAPCAGADTILWVHGYTLDSTIWSAIWEALPGFAHVAPDLPGHGESRAFAPDDTLDTLAEAVLDVAASLGAVRLVGMSFGGMVALQAAIRAPGRFSHLVLASPGLAGGPQDEGAATCNQDLIRMWRARGAGPWLVQRWMSEPPGIFSGARARPALRAQLEAVVARHSWAELGLPVMQTLARQPQDAAAIAAIHAKLLLLVGEHDIPAFLRSAEIIRRNAPLALRETVPAAAHLCLLEEPLACAGLIHAHLTPSESHAHA